MEDNLAAEIARIEAELEADSQFRDHQQQLQQQQQPFLQQTSAFAPQQQQQQQQQPQQQSFFVHAQQPQQQLSHHLQQQQQQQQHGTGAVATPASQPHQFSRDSDGRSIFVGNLPKGENNGPTTTPEELAQLFADCGQILNCTVLRDRTTGELKGTAYIEFASYTGMGKAIDMKNNSNFKGSSIIVTKKRSAFRPDRARGGRGRGGNTAADPYQAMVALMGMMGGAMMQRGGRGGRGRARGSGGPPGGFQPFQ